VVSSGVKMTMIVKVTGGQGIKITSSFMIFQNPKSKNPICGISNNIPNVSYHSIASGFMTSEVFALWLDERRINHLDTNGRQMPCSLVELPVG
jgi:hypothetical protein